MATLTVYQRGETAKVLFYTRSLSGALVDVSSTPTITIVDPRGTKVIDAASMTKFATGSYRYLYNPGSNAVLGKYHVTCICIDGSNTITEKDDFLLQDAYGE